jgi:hypothetical protein
MLKVCANGMPPQCWSFPHFVTNFVSFFCPASMLVARLERLGSWTFDVRGVGLVSPFEIRASRVSRASFFFSESFCQPPRSSALFAFSCSKSMFIRVMIA